MRNLPNVLHTVLSSVPRDLIWSSQIAEDHPRHPVQFVDSDGQPVLDNLDNPISRPDDLPPERYLRAGLANRFLGAQSAGLLQPGTGDGVSDAKVLGAVVALYSALLPVAPGGLLDAERFDGNYVRDYRHYLNIMIGIYSAAAGFKPRRRPLCHRFLRLPQIDIRDRRVDGRSLHALSQAGCRRHEIGL